ncbi:Soluble lytic murein transglycosylase [Rhizobiales bacterium GAS113]|nr:Soluble lytic murein transglycosylase [Rhizobiales bacterium GAS113]
MQSFCNPSSIPLFDRRVLHSFVPTEEWSAGARSFSPMLPSGRRESASPWTELGTLARSPYIGRASVLVVLLVLIAPSLSMPSEASSRRPNLMAEAHARWSSFVAEAAQRFSIPTNWIWSVMRIESQGDTRAVSPKGAVGLMQVMPRTYGALRARHHLGADPFNPHDNILAGSAYVREMYDRYGSPGFLAAYNAGPQRYEDHLNGRRKLPGETRDYLGKLTSASAGVRAENAVFIRSSAASTTQVGLFATNENSMSVSDRSSTGKYAPRARVVDLSALVPRSTGLFLRGSGGGRQ